MFGVRAHIRLPGLRLSTAIMTGSWKFLLAAVEGQRDALLLYKNRQLINIAQDKGLTNATATDGVTSIDLDNNGDLRFTDITQSSGVQGKNNTFFSSFVDLDGDGWQDLVFHQAIELGIDNPFYGQSPLIIDLNADAKPDVVWINMDGPVRAFLNTSPANSLLISAADTVAMLGTRITIEMADGKSYTKQIVANTGLLTDQTPELFFGLGDQKHVERVIIKRTGHPAEIIEAPVINQRIRIR